MTNNVTHSDCATIAIFALFLRVGLGFGIGMDIIKASNHITPSYYSAGSTNQSTNRHKYRMISLHTGQCLPACSGRRVWCREGDSAAQWLAGSVESSLLSTGNNRGNYCHFPIDSQIKVLSHLINGLKNPSQLLINQ